MGFPTSGSMGSGVTGTPISRRQMRFLVAVVAVLTFGTVLTALNVYELHNLTREHWIKDHVNGLYLGWRFKKLCSFGGERPGKPCNSLVWLWIGPPSPHLQDDPEVVWDSVRDAIRNVFYGKEADLIQATSHYPRPSNFFEMMRFDFVIDDQLKVHLMEANMSPNLSSAHFKENRLLYEQVLYNLFSLVGVGRYLHSSSLASQSPDEYEMQVAAKDVVVFPDHCATNCQGGTSACNRVECQLCLPCLSKEQLADLSRAYLEHQQRGACRRVVPQPINPDHAHTAANMSNLTPENTLMTEWFRGQCLSDKIFCS
nr:probable tubulin polyglutamylase ttll-15 [Procambarus clarkii]